ncbi:hypothetical protein P775_19525 [Puniceibacterium antarcticum]|uniref:Glycosyl transferase family 2 n=1 Tax=Puniceibacterium antarcticum TaxID=1206336 RepID=A0A2G8RBG0_9RHOB|nr:glycosyltransferase family 2 protein [Puniceibacterium antarcticum]PIL18761.1 hypothetical protein P775_19525 [Puniceibacterium antarcticum]
MYAPDAQDIRIISNDLAERDGLTLICVFRNEFYLLPAFLTHYRALGVSRFILLDQGDVMLLDSTRRYGDSVIKEERPPRRRSKTDYRQIHLWRTALANRFCDGRWMVQCDVDEFASLPEGRRLDQLARRLESNGKAGAWAGMIDIYPRHISDLGPEADAAQDPREGQWYFDATRHFSLRRDGSAPRHHYAGVRSRLNRAHLAHAKPVGLWTALKLKLLGARKSPSGRFVKPLLQKWQRGNYYLSSHETTLKLRPHVLIPLLHYRYTPALYEKVGWAMDSGGYSKGNSDYFTINSLLANMTAANASFLAPVSRRLTGYNDLKATRNARGLD